MKNQLISFMFIILLFMVTVTISQAQDKIYYGDCQNGFGVKVAADKTTIYGNFLNGKLNGYSLVVMPNGNMYAGFLKDNVCWGEGIFVYAQGYIYMGEYVNNAQQGNGTMFSMNAQIIDGTWNNNQPAQVNKIETKNQNSPCDFGDCEKGPSMTFKDVTSFSCATTDMILERKSAEYQYLGPRSGEGNITIITKEWIYVGMGKDREPYGVGAKVYMSGKKFEVGNWGRIKFGSQETPIFWELNKPCPLQVNLVSQFKLPVTESITDYMLSNNGKRMVVSTEKTGFGFYDSEKKIWKPLSGTDSVMRLAISPDGQYGAYCTKSQIKIFDLAANKLLKTINDKVFRYNFLFSNDGQLLIYSVDTTYQGPWGLTIVAEKARTVNVKTGKRIREFITTNSANDNKRICGDYYFVPYGPYVATNRNSLFVLGFLGIETYELSTGKEIDYKVDTSKVKLEWSCRLLRYAVSPSGNKVAEHMDWGTRVFDIKYEPNQTWYPGIYLDNFDKYTTTRKGYFDENIKSTNVYSLYFMSDENGLLAVTSNDIVLVDLRKKVAGSSISSTGGVYTFLREDIMDLNTTADGTKIYIRNDRDEVYVYEIKFN